MNSRQRKVDCIAALLALTALNAAAQEASVQSIESLRQVASSYVLERMGGQGQAAMHAEAGTLDPRLRLPACTRPEAFAPNGELRAGTRVTVGVRCAQPAWSVYVPVAVETELPVLVLRHALPRSSVIAATDVETQRRRVPGVAASYITDIAQLTNRHLRTTAAPGTALTVDLLAADVLVKRGQRVTLIASAGGLEVRAQGQALADAQPDGRIRVLNLASGRTVEGQVESRDSVRISL